MLFSPSFSFSFKKTNSCTDVPRGAWGKSFSKVTFLTVRLPLKWTVQAEGLCVQPTARLCLAIRSFPTLETKCPEPPALHIIFLRVLPDVSAASTVDGRPHLDVWLVKLFHPYHSWARRAQHLPSSCTEETVESL